MRIILFATLCAGCFESHAPPCAVDCTSDAECPSGLSCNGTKCSVGGAACTAVRCENAGDRRCDETDARNIQVCDETGQWSLDETCMLGCVEEGAQSARCGSLQPSIAALTDVCDAPATGQVSFGMEVFATDSDPRCTTMAQVDGPTICVVRAAQISVQPGSTLRVSGVRAFALVADLDLDVLGTIDVSAMGAQDGPGGGGPRISGVAVNTGRGGGGAGFQTVGGAGGNIPGSGGMTGIDASLSDVLAGGYRAPSDMNMGGAAGGALALISCTGTVSVSGVLDAAGAGGIGGGLEGGDFRGSGSGGGSGGVLLLQAGSIVVAGGLFANGGGGGGGSDINPGLGTAGGKGTRSTTAGAAGGQPIAMGGMGGIGGYAGAPPSDGTGGGTGQSAGGGGGSVGYIVLSTPNGLTPSVLSGAQVSPVPETTHVGVR